MVEIKPPHRVIDEVLDALTEIPKHASEVISSAIDKGPLGDAGPHRGVDALVKGEMIALQSAGEGLAKALDVPLRIGGKK